MSMTITLNSWWIPSTITALLWMWALLMPSETSGSGYFGSIDVNAMFRGFVAIVGTLLTWCIYFAARFILG